MCLITNRAKPVVAKTDIYCIKELEQRGKGYRTPYQETPVKLDVLIETKGKDTSELGKYEKRSIGAGFIHAHTGLTSYGGFIAVIPAGTEYYLQDDFCDICAKKMIITSTKTSDGNKAASPENIRNMVLPLLEEFLDDETKVGYYVMPDKTFVSPLEITPEQGSAAIGIVVDYDDEKKERIVWSLEQKELPWCPDYGRIREKHVRIDIGSEAREYEDTDACMKTVLDSEAYKKNPDDFPAFKYVSEFKTEGTEAGDWRIDAPGRLVSIFMDGLVIANAAMVYTGIGKRIDGWYWSSAESSQSFAWSCHTHYANVYHTNKWSSYYVRPSLALPA